MVAGLPFGYHVNKMKCYQSSQAFVDGREMNEASVKENSCAVKLKPSSIGKHVGFKAMYFIDACRLEGIYPCWKLGNF